MENKEKISRRNALKRMSKVAITVAISSIFPSVNVLANESSSQYVNSYIDKCYSDYSNYHKYINYDDYNNYGNYRNYSNHNDYNNYHNYTNYSDSQNTNG